MSHWMLRLLKHRRLDERDAERLIGAGAMQRIEALVASSESRHSGEIRVCVEAGLPYSYIRRGATPRERAVGMFSKLRVWDTEAGNGVLIYLLLAEHAIEIVADRALSRHVDAGQWQQIMVAMQSAFKTDRFEDGLTQAVAAVDVLLTRHFPLAPGAVNTNELPNAPYLR